MELKEKLTAINSIIKSFKERQNAEALAEHERIEHLINDLSYTYDMPSQILAELRQLNSTILTRFQKS